MLKNHKLFVFIFSIALTFSVTSVFSQYTPNNGVCELPLFEDWSTGNGANPCACIWFDPVTGYRLCSYGNCGNAEFNECASGDCAGTGGAIMPNPGWHQGGGELRFCYLFDCTSS